MVVYEAQQTYKEIKHIHSTQVHLSCLMQQNIDTVDRVNGSLHTSISCLFPFAGVGMGVGMYIADVETEKSATMFVVEQIKHTGRPTKHIYSRYTQENIGNAATSVSSCKYLSCCSILQVSAWASACVSLA